MYSRWLLSFRKLYRPGLISLVFIPLLLIVYLVGIKTFDQKYSIEVNYFTKEDIRMIAKEYPALFSENGYWQRQYKYYLFSENSIDDDEKTRLAEIEIKRLIAQKDTLRGVHFAFADGAKFGEFVRVLNLCMKNNDHITYILKKNDVYITSRVQFNFAKKEYFLCGTMFYSKSVEAQPYLSLKERIMEIVGAYLQPYWYFYMLLIVMFIFSIKEGYWKRNNLAKG